MSTEIPKRGTDEYRWWRAGATAEAYARHEGMIPSGRNVFDLVETMAQRGDDGNDITDMVAVVYTVEWPLRWRLSLAWRILWGPYGLKISSARARRRQRKTGS